MPDDTLVSVIITNYNYSRYVSEAVESALAQRGCHTEVIVVDDGSTDDSLELLKKFGDRIILIAQANAGQGGAFNTGVAASRGDICCFLDADDVMLPDRARLVRDLARSNPDSGLFIHPVQQVDATRAPFGVPIPTSTPNGSLATLLDKSGGHWPSPPTSGLALRRTVLDRMLPIPAAPWRISADAYLVALAPYLTAVSSLAEPLSLYRLHGSNAWAKTPSSRYETVADLRERAMGVASRFNHVAKRASELGIARRARLADNYQYQFTLAELGSASSLARLARMAFFPPPFLGRSEAARAPVGAVRRYLLRHLIRDLRTTPTRSR